MRTTIDLPDPLLNRAKALARVRHTTLRALVEEGLHAVLSEQRNAEPYVLEDLAFRGKGLAEGLSEGDWEHIRALSYEGRGG